MLSKLFATIQDRKKNRPAGSYTVHLFDAGTDTILQKVGEEAVEVILAGKGQGNQRLIEEVADLFYHTLVLLSAYDITLENVENELKKRHHPDPV